MAETNTKRVRLIDVAQKAGVSRIVAGQVLLGSGGKTTRVAPATAERVRDAARELDYRPNLIARQLSGVRTKTLAALIGADRYTIHYDRMRAIDSEADQRGYRLMVGYLHGDREGVIEDLLKRLDEMLGRGVEGIVLMQRFFKLPERVVERLSQTHVVSCQTQPALPNAHCVDVDIVDGLEQLVDHVVERGRRRPALVLDKNRPSNNRRAGFISAYKRHELGKTPPIWSAELEEDTTDPKHIRTLVDQLIDAHLKKSKCDAIIATNDLWAVQIIKALLARGISVPDDIAVTGIDNVEIAAACIPELTTIDQCNELIAQTVMDKMIRLIEGKRIAKKDRVTRIRPKLVIREST